MPTTLTSLLLFVVLLLPGFVYLTCKERHGTERHISTFRETVTIVTASIMSSARCGRVRPLMWVHWSVAAPPTCVITTRSSWFGESAWWRCQQRLPTRRRRGQRPRRTR